MKRDKNRTSPVRGRCSIFRINLRDFGRNSGAGGGPAYGTDHGTILAHPAGYHSHSFWGFGTAGCLGKPGKPLASAWHQHTPGLYSPDHFQPVSPYRKLSLEHHRRKCGNTVSVGQVHDGLVKGGDCMVHGLHHLENHPGIPGPGCRTGNRFFMDISPAYVPHPGHLLLPSLPGPLIITVPQISPYRPGAENPVVHSGVVTILSSLSFPVPFPPWPPGAVRPGWFPAPPDRCI